jgi:hypothetical protein
MRAPQSEVIEWLSSEENPPVRYLTARDLHQPPDSAGALADLRKGIMDWWPMQEVLERQDDTGAFAASEGGSLDARATFWALCLMQRCGLDITDEPVDAAIDYLDRHHRKQRAVSYTTGGGGVLPCYAGVTTAALIKMGAVDTDLVQDTIQWLVDHQRFDHKSTRAGGTEPWPYQAPKNYGCWETVSCYHGVAGAFRAFAALPPDHRTPVVEKRLAEALDYLRIHRLYKKSKTERPLFRHMTQSFIIGDYRSDLLDMLQAISDADPSLVNEPWVRSAVEDMRGLTVDDRVVLVKNYGKRLIDPVPFEPLGEPSRFLTYQWTVIDRTFSQALAAKG